MHDVLLPPTIDPQASWRWAQRPWRPESPWLHEEVARRMAERLDVIRLQPTHWIDWEPSNGGLQAHQSLCQRYPEASVLALEPVAQRASALQQAWRRSWWQRLMRPAPARVVQTTAPRGQAQMLWANMLLHQVADPVALIQAWHAALAVDGFLMFSCLGPDTLRQLRALYARQGWPAPAHEFTDMHDWGDLLVQTGFAEPVMDVERITLTFSSPERLLQELRALGRNGARSRSAVPRGRAWHREWLQTVQAELDVNPKGQAHTAATLALDFEVIYGHASKAAPRAAQTGATTVPLSEMRERLRAAVKGQK